MRSAERLFALLDRAWSALTALCVGGMLFCVFLQVVSRTFNLSINWTTELSQYFFLWSTTFATYIAARRGKMIGVELVQKALPPALRRVMKFVAWGSAAFFYGFVIYHCSVAMPMLWDTQTPVLRWSMGIVYTVMLVGLGLLALYSAYLALCGLLIAPPTNDGAQRKTAAQIAEEVE